MDERHGKARHAVSREDGAGYNGGARQASRLMDHGAAAVQWALNTAGRKSVNTTPHGYEGAGAPNEVFAMLAEDTDEG